MQNRSSVWKAEVEIVAKAPRGRRKKIAAIGSSSYNVSCGLLIL